MDSISLKPIATLYNDFPTKFGLPRQGGLARSLQGTIIFEPNYRQEESLRGLEMFSHLWLLWHFSEEQAKAWTPTVRPPRLGGNTRMGVFATRSPHRPNPIGLTCARLESIEHHTTQGPVIHISGIDLKDGTPLFDIKPYIPYADCFPEATYGFTEQYKEYRLQVVCSDELLQMIPFSKRQALLEALANDPRPAYHHNSERVYGFLYAGFDIHFKVNNGILSVCEIFRYQQ